MITGGIKFFGLSVANIDDGASITSDDGSDPSLVFNDHGQEIWVSPAPEGTNVGLSIGFSAASYNRILIVGHNAKSFSISGNFKNTTDIFNNRISNGPIQARNNTSRVSYFAFDTIQEGTGGQIVLTELMEGQDHFEISKIIFCQEIGTFEGHPTIGQVSFEQNSRNVRAKSGRYLITKQDRTVRAIPLQFKNYSNREDIALADLLHESESPFLIWPCGGNEEQFRFSVQGYKLQDIYKVQTMGQFRKKYNSGSYSQVLSASLNLVESV